MKHKILALVGSVLLGMVPMYSAFAADASQPSLKIAVVNVQQILQQSARVTDLSKKLEDQFKPRQQKLSDQQKSLQDEVDKLKKDSSTMAQKDRDNLQKKVESDRAALVKQVVSYQQDLNKEQSQIMQGLLSDLNGIVSGIAKKSNFNLVLDAQAVVYAPDSTDITKQVSDQFNKK
ncbi:MAG TPA: OmpH family outer membrane protein [Gammaproteobacteria bacterium]|nr:OmpH family outer membrane protein [Gammaproteobacteria bacterium]